MSDSTLEIFYTEPEYHTLERKWEILKLINGQVAERIYSIKKESAVQLRAVLMRDVGVERNKRLGSPYDAEARMDLCFSLHLFGYSIGQIHQYVSTGGEDGIDVNLFWNISLRTIDKYIKRMKKRINEKPKKEREKAIVEAKERWKYLFSLSVKSKDLGSARASLKELDKLEGVTEHDIRVKVDDVKKLSDEDLMKQLNQIINYESTKST